MKEIKPTNETGKNPETEQEKEVLPSFFQTLEHLDQQASPQQRGAGVQHHAFGTGENQYRRLQGDDKGGQENGRGHQAPIRPCITPSVQLKGNSKKELTSRRKPIGDVRLRRCAPKKTSRHSGRPPGKSPSPWSSTSPSRARDSASCSDICALKDAISLPPNSTSSPSGKP